jgi:hypothetical protein
MKWRSWDCPVGPPPKLFTTGRSCMQRQGADRSTCRQLPSCCGVWLGHELSSLPLQGSVNRLFVFEAACGGKRAPADNQRAHHGFGRTISHNGIHGGGFGARGLSVSCHLLRVGRAFCIGRRGEGKNSSYQGGCANIVASLCLHPQGCQRRLGEKAHLRVGVAIAAGRERLGKRAPEGLDGRYSADTDVNKLLTWVFWKLVKSNVCIVRLRSHRVCRIGMLLG